jgi:hypothetical protein
MMLHHYCLHESHKYKYNVTIKHNVSFQYETFPTHFQEISIKLVRFDILMEVITKITVF